MTTAVIIVLAVIGAGAVLTVPLVIWSTRRSASTPRPALGSPAQVWVERGERVLGEFDASVWPEVAADAAAVVAELRISAGQVAELEALIARLADASTQRADRDALLAGMAAAVAGLERARDELAELIARTTPATGGDDATMTPLISRLAGLRAGLAEVGGQGVRANPEAGSGSKPQSQGHP